MFNNNLQKLNIERKLIQNKFENTIKTINTKNDKNTLNNYELFYDNPNSNNATNINSNIVNPDEKPNLNEPIFNNDNYNQNIIDSGQATQIITGS